MDRFLAVHFARIAAERDNHAEVIRQFEIAESGGTALTAKNLSTLFRAWFHLRCSPDESGRVVGQLQATYERLRALAPDHPDLKSMADAIANAPPRRPRRRSGWTK